MGDIVMVDKEVVVVEVVRLVVGIVDLRVEVEKDCLMINRAGFGTYHQSDLDHQS